MKRGVRRMRIRVMTLGMVRLACEMGREGMMLGSISCLKIFLAKP
jgi:hypothetical protein